MTTVVVRVRGLSRGTLNHIDGLSDDIWVEWPQEGDEDSGPQIVGSFDEVNKRTVVLKWKQSKENATHPETGETTKPKRGFVGIPLQHVEAIITIRGQ